MTQQKFRSFPSSQSTHGLNNMIETKNVKALDNLSHCFSLAFVQFPLHSNEVRSKVELLSLDCYAKQICSCFECENSNLRRLLIF